MSGKCAAHKRANCENHKLDTVLSYYIHAAPCFNAVNELSCYKRYKALDNDFARDKQRTEQRRQLVFTDTLHKSFYHMHINIPPFPLNDSF